MATSDPPVRGGPAVREPGKPEAFTITVLGKEKKVPTKGKDLQIIVRSGKETFKLPLNKKHWSMRIELI